MSSCNQNVSWAITGQDNPSIGWTTCKYNYDYSNFALGNPKNGLVQLFQWLQDVYSGTNNSVLSGMDEHKYRIRDSNIVYSVLTEFYNQIFSQGYYTDNPSSNPFQNFDYVSNNIQNYGVQNIILPITSTFQTLYDSGVFPVDLEKILERCVAPPLPVQNGTTYSLIFQLSYQMYSDFESSSDQNGYLSGLLSGILQDTTGRFNNIQSGQEWSPGNPSLVNYQVESISAVTLVDATGTPTYEFISGISLSEWNSTNYPYHIFSTVQISADVSEWSPMLVVYFQSYSSVTFDKKTCELISSTCGSSCIGKSTLPSSCFNLECSDKPSCLNTFTNYCTIAYDPPPFLNHIETDNYLLTNDNSNCYCYTSGLTPVGIQQGGNPAAMCFDSNCNSTIRSDFNLTDLECKNYCPTIWEWMNSTDPATQPQNKSTMDWDRFASICGKDYKPYLPSTFNKQVLGLGTITTCMLSMLVFSGCKYRDYTTKKTLTITVIVFVIMIFIVIFISRDLAGIPICNGKTFQCKSRITNRNIPSKFCNFIFNCECELDSDCSNDCVCVSSTCQPRAGTRPTITVQKRELNIPLIIFIIIAGLILPLLLIFLHKDYHWNISKKVFVPIVVIASLSIIGLGIYYILKKTSVNVFTGPCCTKSCDNKNCGTDGCGGTCGSCQKGTMCVNGVCTPQINGCPQNSTLSPPVSTISTGVYYITTIINGQYVYLSTQQDKAPLLLSSTPSPWNYDAVTGSLSSGGIYAVSSDFCWGNSCGSGKTNCGSKTAPVGILYGIKDFTEENPVNFLLGSDYIFSVNSNLYIVPSGSPSIQGSICPNCTNGPNMVTFTDQESTAHVWVISQYPIITGCPYLQSTLQVPIGLPEGNYYISSKVGNTALGIPGDTFPARLYQGAPVQWSYTNNTLSQESVFLSCYDPCWNTNCGNNSFASCFPQSTVPSGILYGFVSPHGQIPILFVLGTDFIFSIDSRAYVVPDTRPEIAYKNTQSCPNCAQGGGVYLTLTLYESDAHVWNITNVSSNKWS